MMPPNYRRAVDKGMEPHARDCNPGKMGAIPATRYRAGGGTAIVMP